MNNPNSQSPLSLSTDKDKQCEGVRRAGRRDRTITPCLLPLFSPAAITAHITSHIHVCVIVQPRFNSPSPTGRDRRSYNGFTNELKNGHGPDLEPVLIKRETNTDLVISPQLESLMGHSTDFNCHWFNFRQEENMITRHRKTTLHQQPKSKCASLIFCTYVSKLQFKICVCNYMYKVN